MKNWVVPYISGPGFWNSGSGVGNYRIYKNYLPNFRDFCKPLSLFLYTVINISWIFENHLYFFSFSIFFCLYLPFSSVSASPVRFTSTLHVGNAPNPYGRHGFAPPPGGVSLNTFHCSTDREGLHSLRSTTPLSR